MCSRQTNNDKMITCRQIQTEITTIAIKYIILNDFPHVIKSTKRSKCYYGVPNVSCSWQLTIFKGKFAFWVWQHLSTVPKNGTPTVFIKASCAFNYDMDNYQTITGCCRRPLVKSEIWQLKLVWFSENLNSATHG